MGNLRDIYRRGRMSGIAGRFFHNNGSGRAPDSPIVQALSATGLVERTLITQPKAKRAPTKWSGSWDCYYWSRFVNADWLAVCSPSVCRRSN